MFKFKTNKIKNFLVLIAFCFVLLLSTSITATNAQSQTNPKILISEATIDSIEQNAPCIDKTKSNSCVKYTLLVDNVNGNSLEKHYSIEDPLSTGNTKTWNFKKNDRVLVYTKDGSDEYKIYDIIRERNYLWLLGGIVVLMLIVFGYRIYKVVLSAAVAFIVISYVMVPYIINNPTKFYFISISFIFLIMGAILFIHKGFNKKTFFSFFIACISTYLISALILLIFDRVLRIDSTGLPNDSLGKISKDSYFVRNIYYIKALVTISGFVAYIAFKQTEIVSTLHELKNGALTKAQLLRLSIQKGFDDTQMLIPVVLMVVCGFDLFKFIIANPVTSINGINANLYRNETDFAATIGNVICLFLAIVLIIPLSTVLTTLFIRYEKDKTFLTKFGLKKVSTNKQSDVVGLEIPENLIK
jgi:uncharacterized membrane protein